MAEPTDLRLVRGMRAIERELLRIAPSITAGRLRWNLGQPLEAITPALDLVRLDVSLEGKTVVTLHFLTAEVHASGSNDGIPLHVRGALRTRIPDRIGMELRVDARFVDMAWTRIPPGAAGSYYARSSASGMNDHEACVVRRDGRGLWLDTFGAAVNLFGLNRGPFAGTWEFSVEPVA